MTYRKTSTWAPLWWHVLGSRKFIAVIIEHHGSTRHGVAVSKLSSLFVSHVIYLFGVRLIYHVALMYWVIKE